MKILFIGDIMGNPGMHAVSQAQVLFKEQGRAFDFVIANIENSAGGFGLNKDAWAKLQPLNFDCMTSGNHIWDRPDVSQFLNEEPKLLRPANYPPGSPGFGWQIFDVKNKTTDAKIAIINLQGRIFMQNIDCPFQAADSILEQIGDKCKIIMVDFHAEATSEKQAMGWFLDGRVSAVVGTHIHVQTAEERILPGGTGFITDVGMCGAYDSVIGMEIEDALFRFIKGRPNRLKVAAGNVKFAALSLDIDNESGKCLKVERLLWDIPTI